MSTRPMSGCAIPCSIASATPLITIPETNGAIYPMYDWAHTLSDYIEGITHSVCTLEFEVHRPLYDWILQALELPPPVPHQYEFARLNLTYTVMSKRKLIQLVNEKLVNGWDDPRMITIAGLRRRGVTASALRSFAYNIGITKYPSMTDMAVLDHTIRDEFNRTAERRLVVLHPLKVVLTNYPEGKVEDLEAVNNPEDETAGKRKVPFSRELFIDAADFMETPPPKYFRLKPGGEVRLKYAYIIKCNEVVKDSSGNVTELRCTVDLESKSGGATSNRKVKGTIHWVSAAHALDAEVRLYDRLFTAPEPDATGDFKSFINPHSLEVVTAKCEPALAEATPEKRYQFERLGYFALDPDSTATKQVWNRTVTLKDTWAKKRRDASCTGRRRRIQLTLFGTTAEIARRLAARDDRARTCKRAIDSREHLFFPENFEQVIKARAGVAAGNRETGRMDNRADLYPKLFRGRFHRSFNFAG